MADNEYKSNAQADKKQQAKEAKRKQRQEELANIDEIEKYKIEEKAAKRNQKDKVKQEQQKEEKEKKPSVPAKEKGVKKSRPTPARAPFHFFKDDQKGKSEEEIQAAWKAISPEDKKVIFFPKYSQKK